MNRFLYSALRFVPDPMKGEFVNVGVIAGSDVEEQWGIRTIQRTGRATALMGSSQRAWPAVASQIAEFQATIDEYLRCAQGLRAGHPEEFVSEEWLGRASQDFQNMLQVTPPMPILGSAVEEVLDLLWTRLIEEPDPRKSPVTKSTIRSGIAQNLRRLVAGRHGQVATLATLSTQDTHADIDIVTHNGHVAHLTQCYSFDVADLGSLLDSVKAWGWTVRDLRENGGTVSVRNHALPVGKDVRVDVVYFAPEREESREALREARTVFDDGEVKANSYPREHAQQVVNAAAALVGEI